MKLVALLATIRNTDLPIYVEIAQHPERTGDYEPFMVRADKDNVIRMLSDIWADDDETPFELEFDLTDPKEEGFRINLLHNGEND